MQVLEWNKKLTMDEADFPLTSVQVKTSLVLEFQGDVPQAAKRRLAMQILQRLVAAAHEEELLTLAGSEADIFSSSPEGQNGHTHAPQTHRPGQPSWMQPAGLDLRVVKSAHRIVLEVAKRGESGRPVLAAELVGAMGLSAPTVGRLLRHGEPGNDYLAQFVRINPDGRTKALDLTSEGRMLASKIRAGVVPT